MIDPVVCADGHTYERAGITQWLKRNDTSPNTGLTLPHKNLTSNIALRSAIQHNFPNLYAAEQAVTGAIETGADSYSTDSFFSSVEASSDEHGDEHEPGVGWYNLGLTSLNNNLYAVGGVDDVDGVDEWNKIGNSPPRGRYS